MAAKKIVEVSDGKTVYGTFSSEAKAKAFRKELKAKGIQTKMYIELLDVPKEPEKPKKAKAPKKTAPAKKKPIPRKKTETKKAPAPDLGDPRTSVKAWYARGHPDGKDFERIDPRATFGDVVWAVYDGADVYKELGPVSDSMRAEVFREIDRRNNTEDGRLDRSWKGREDKGWLEGAVTMDGVIEPPQKRKQYPGLKPEPKKESATAKKKAPEKKAEAATGKRFEPPGWRGPVLPAEELMESFREPKECILLDNGWSYSIRMVPGAGGKVRLLMSEEGGQDVVPAVFDLQQLECDGRYLAIREKGTTWWYEIRKLAPGKMAAPRNAPVPRDHSDDIDLSACSIHDLAGFLYLVQETCINHRVWNEGGPKGRPNPVHSAAEIESILSNPVLAPGLCKTYLSCYITQFGQGWGGWDDSIVSYTDWKRAEARLNSINDSIMKAVKNSSDKPKRKAAAPMKKAQAKKRTSGRRSAEIDEDSIAGSIRAGIRKGCAKEGMDERDFTTILERSGCSFHTVVEGPDGVKALISIIHGDKGYSYEIVDPRSKLDSSGHCISEGDIPKVIEGLAGSVVSMIRTEIERRSTMKRKSPAGNGPDILSQDARGIAEELYWGRTSTGKNGFLEDAYIEGKEGVYQLCVEMVRSDEDSEWTVSVQRGAMIVERPRQMRTKDADARETVRLCRVRAVEAFLRHDVFVLEASKKEYERSFRDRKDGDDGKKKPVKRSKPRNLSASKGQYSASYYERLERDLRRAEKEGDNEAIIAITREIAESMSAEGEEIPDAKAYLEDSDYDELARNSRWKYDSRELNRRYLQKIRDEQRMFGNANRKKSTERTKTRS